MDRQICVRKSLSLLSNSKVNDDTNLIYFLTTSFIEWNLVKFFVVFVLFFLH